MINFWCKLSIEQFENQFTFSLDNISARSSSNDAIDASTFTFQPLNYNIDYEQPSSDKIKKT